MLKIRSPESIFQTRGTVENGTFSGRWHFSFDSYFDPEFVQFGSLRVFNDDILSPGAVWPLHPHREIEVVTYCAGGEFKHADENGLGGILKKGDIQHTTVGSGMWHSEINNKKDLPMRFIQMWFIPEKSGLLPSVEQKKVSPKDKTNKFHLAVSNIDKNALRIKSDAAVFTCSLKKKKTLSQNLESGRGYYLYVLEGGPVQLNENEIPELASVMISEENNLIISSKADTELLLVDVGPTRF